MAKRAAAAAVALAAGLYAGCGGSHPTQPGAIVQSENVDLDPCAIAPGRVVARNTWHSGPQGGSSTPVTMAQRGVIQAVADWTSQRNSVDLFLVDGDCREFPSSAGAPACPSVYGRAEGRDAKPKVLKACVNSGTYRVVLMNRGPDGEDGTLKIDAR